MFAKLYRFNIDFFVALAVLKCSNRNITKEEFQKLTYPFRLKGALERLLRGVPLPDCAGPELRKSEVDLFLCREANKRPPFREEVASSFRPRRRAGDAW